MHGLVGIAIELTKMKEIENEISSEFVMPPWSVNLRDTLYRQNIRSQKIAEVECRIDEEIYRLYCLGSDDRRVIEAELAEPKDEEITDAAREETSEFSEPIDSKELAFGWISYALGIIMSRFQPGVAGALGCSRFPKEVAERLRSLTDNDGVATLDEGHQDDLARKVWEALEIMLGEAGASEVVETVLEEGNP